MANTLAIPLIKKAARIGGRQAGEALIKALLNNPTISYQLKTRIHAHMSGIE